VGAHIRTLKLALGSSKGDDEMISVDSIRRVIQWVQNCHNNDILSILYSVFTTEYFYGIMDDDQASKILLEKGGKPGTYMVRFSPSKEKFVFDYLPKKKKNSQEDPKILSETLSVIHLDELDKAVDLMLCQLGIKKDASCGNRPEYLVELKLHAHSATQFFETINIGHLSITNSHGPGIVSSEGGILQYHYNFIL